MFQIVEKRILNPSVKLLKVSASLIARKANPFRFVMFRVIEDGERIPLTIADTSLEDGTVTIFFQELGKITKILGE